MDLRFQLVSPKRPLRFDITDKVFLRALTGSNPDMGIPELRSVPGYDAAQKEFQTLLRSYVDQWISTGVSEDQSEHFSERGQLRNDWFREGRPLPYALEKLKVVTTLRTLVHDALRGPSQTCLGDDGLEIVFSTFEPKMEREPLNGLAEREAKRYFVWFLASTLRYRLGKCRNCGRYGVKTRRVYSRGTYCRACKSGTGAREITERKRRELWERRKKAVAATLGTWEDEFDLKSLVMRKRLAGQANGRLKKEERITSKWIVINYKFIRSSQS